LFMEVLGEEQTCRRQIGSINIFANPSPTPP
jgi:hypothetical protein